MNWAVSRNNHYRPTVLEGFLDANEADAWIIAYAMKHSHIITTHKKSQPTAKNKI